MAVGVGGETGREALPLAQAWTLGSAVAMAMALALALVLALAQG